MSTRNYQQIVDDIIREIPTRVEVASLSEEQIETLRKYGNCYDNTLYLASAKGRAVVEQACKQDKLDASK